MDPADSRPRIAYLVCATPRSGSSLLCGLLDSSGIAGRPQEYFWRDDVARNAPRWKVTSYAGYVAAAVRAGTTPNGVFAAKLMWGYLAGVLAELRALDPHAGSDRALLAAALGSEPSYVLLRREDVAAQAVSFARAVQTGVWSAADDPRRAAAPAYDFGMIHALAEEVVAHVGAWRRWFRAQGVEPLELRYEDVIGEEERAVRRVLAHIGVSARRELSVEPQTRRQADELNVAWADRYRRELAERGLPPPGARQAG